MKQIWITISAVALMGLLGLVVLSSASPIGADSTEVKAAVTEAQTKVFAIENMTCPACPFTVKKAMARVAGVKKVTVDFDAKTATAEFDPTVASIDDIANASSGVGYPATPIESSNER